MSILSQYWLNIQGNLFPWLAEELGPLSDKQQQVITVLELACIEQYIQSYYGCVGRLLEDRGAIARAFVAKAVYNMPSTVALIDRLHTDKALRRICGWERKGEIPSEATFSRAFAEFARGELANRVHASLIQHYHSDRIVGHISRDSTAIEARERVSDEGKQRAQEQKAKKQAKAAKGKAKRGRPKGGSPALPKEQKRLEKQQTMTVEAMLEDLPKGCDIGTKRNSKGSHTRWRGYKLHIDTADGGIPISALLTPASVHDSQVALPLAVITASRVQHCYELMDAAYDSDIIREYSQKLGSVPLIDYNHRSPKDTRTFAPHEAQRYKERSTAERVNARLKDEFGGRVVRVRGDMKVMAHLMFGIIAITVDSLIRFVT